MKKSGNVTPEAHIVGQPHDSAGVIVEIAPYPFIIKGMIVYYLFICD
jgi:hypothetical protein